MNNPILGFEHIYIDNHSARTLLLLHGTGGDEQDLVPIGKVLDSHANILSPRGKVLEDGMLRFFKRLKPGVFDRQDLKDKSVELGNFLVECSKVYNFPLSGVVAVGYSNGANIALHLLTSNPEILARAVLLRPMAAGVADDVADLSNTRLLILAGLTDSMVPIENFKELVKNLQNKKAQVRFHELVAGHGLTNQDMAYAQEWISEVG